MKLKKTRTLKLFATSLLFWVLIPTPSIASVSANDVLDHYTKLAEAIYEDALFTARELQSAVNNFVDNPTEDNLTEARAAWQVARVPYQQSEVYRFGNPIVDDWEGKVNAWPLDEGLLDYVHIDSYGTESEENPGYLANVIGNTNVIVSGETIDVSNITKELLAETLQELGGSESNVATGYHAIEFLLWGQDLNGTGPGAGNRPASDFDLINCTNGNCDRRATYLQTATDLLVDDLEWIVDQWSVDGAATQNVLNAGNNQDLSIIFTGMGSLSYGELAGERMQLGLLLHDPEEEHDCFSDNTHASHFFDALGILNIYHGVYSRIDGSRIEGPSVSDLVAAASVEADISLTAALDATMLAMVNIVNAAEDGEAYDQQIGDGNEAGNRRVQTAIEMLKKQTREIENAVNVLNLASIEFEGSDSLDDPEAIFE